MNDFRTYLLSKKNILIIWFIIHGFALFVNYFGITGELEKSSSTQHKNNEEWTYFKSTYLFSRSYDESEFWPFVKFKRTTITFAGTKTEEDGFDIRVSDSAFVKKYKTINTFWETNSFRGVFYQYDISEFIAYSILIFLVLYIRFSTKSSIK